MKVFELPLSEFARAAPLFAPAWYDQAFIGAALEGRQPARLFVEDPASPGAALLCRTFEFYVAGSPAPALRRFILDAPAEPGVFQDLYGYVPIGDAWHRALLADHGDRLTVIGRREFKFERACIDPSVRLRYALPSNAAIVPIDRTLASRIDRDLHQLIGAFWGGYDRFMRDGFGYCTMIDGTVASVAYAIAVSSRFANVDIVTADPYRRRGLSTLTSAAFIDHCLRHGLVATWDADAGNHASVATALRLGLREYPSFNQLSPPGYAKLPLSHGRWTADYVPDASGGALWTLSTPNP